MSLGNLKAYVSTLLKQLENNEGSFIAYNTLLQIINEFSKWTKETDEATYKLFLKQLNELKD